VKNLFTRELCRIEHGGYTILVKLPLFRFKLFERDMCIDYMIIFGAYWGLPKEKFHAGEMVYRRQFELVWKGWPFYIRNY
jgi:hypothetical protein